MESQQCSRLIHAQGVTEQTKTRRAWGSFAFALMLFAVMLVLAVSWSSSMSTVQHREMKASAFLDAELKETISFKKGWCIDEFINSVKFLVYLQAAFFFDFQEKGLNKKILSRHHQGSTSSTKT
jgi:hypothetical protein